MRDARARARRRRTLSGMSEPTNVPDDDSRHRERTVDDARRFHLSEDWLATVVGLTLVVLTAAGVVTESWLPL